MYCDPLRPTSGAATQTEVENLSSKARDNLHTRIYDFSSVGDVGSTLTVCAFFTESGSMAVQKRPFYATASGQMWEKGGGGGGGEKSVRFRKIVKEEEEVNCIPSFFPWFHRRREASNRS